MVRLIIHDFDVLGPDVILATRAAEWITGQPPEKRDAILTYGGKVDMFVQRNRSGKSITVRMLRREPAVKGT